MNQPSSRSGLTTFTVIIIGLLALFLLIGGIWLATLGGSIYYIVAESYFSLLHGNSTSALQLLCGFMLH